MDLQYGSYKAMVLLSENLMQWLTIIFAVVIVAANFREFKILSTAYGVSFKLTPMLVINLLLVPITLVSLPIFGIYRLIVYTILSARHGSKFGGMLEGADAILHLECVMPNLGVFVVQYENKNPKPFYDFVKEVLREPILSVFKDDPRMFSTIGTSFGYSYFLRDAVSFEDCLRKMKTIDCASEEITKDDLTKLMSDHVHFSEDFKGLWQLEVGSQPIKWEKTEDDSVKYYPIFLKINHAVGDGLHVVKGILEVLSSLESLEYDNPNSAKNFLKTLKRDYKNNQSNEETHFSIITLLKKGERILKAFITQCYPFLVLPSAIAVIDLVAVIKPNILLGPKLSHQYFRCFSIEDSRYCLPATKRIKRKIPGITFQDVLLTAFTASLCEYYTKRSAQIPEYLLAPLAKAPELTQFIDFLLSDLMMGTKKCQNTTIVDVRKLPIALAAEGNTANLVKVLKVMKKERENCDRSVAAEICSIMRDAVGALLPEPLLLAGMHQNNQFSVSVSNLPGPPYLLTARGCLFPCIICFSTHGKYTGITLMITSGDERIQLAFGIDRALISDPQEAQDIADGVFKYVHLLDKECLNYNMPL